MLSTYVEVPLDVAGDIGHVVDGLGSAAEDSAVVGGGQRPSLSVDVEVPLGMADDDGLAVDSCVDVTEKDNGVDGGV